MRVGTFPKVLHTINQLSIRDPGHSKENIITIHQIIDGQHLVKVSLRSLSGVPDTLGFYMGKNTPERRDYIMENLL